jgi:hypothetical protein
MPSRSPRNLVFRGTRGGREDNVAGQGSMLRQTAADPPDIDGLELEHRKKEVADFLSHFGNDDNTLPFEWAEHEGVDDNVTLAGSQVSSSNWIRFESFTMTQLQWACYQKEGTLLEMYRQQLSPLERAVRFHAKLAVRFTAVLDEYNAGDLDAVQTSNGLQHLVEQAEEDLRWRLSEHKNLLSRAEKTSHAKRLLNALVDVLTKVARPAESGTPVEDMLFDAFFVDEEVDEFMLDAIEVVLSGNLDMEIQDDILPKVQEIHRKLQNVGPRQGYLAHLQGMFREFAARQRRMLE